MNRRISILMCQAALGLSASAVPLRWTVETSRAVPATFEAYQGETLNFEAALTSYGKPIEAPSNYSFFWQTNGMGNAFWSVPCPSSATTTNVLFATWSPTNDVGAKVYTCFIGQPGTIYHAAFQLRLRHSPGAIPNELPLPTPVIDFAKVRVLNPPWSGGGGGGVDTNAVRDIAREEITPATNRLYQTLTDSTNRLYKTLIDSKDGAARPLPKYLHLYNADGSYPDAAAEYYRSRGNGKTDGGCSSVRDGGFLYRNFDFPFDDRAEFVVKMSAVNCRFASVGVAQVGTNLTEQMVTSGKWSKWYKALPGATVDGINENGVACNINVVDGNPQTSGWHNDTGDLHPLAAIRWILDNATNAQHAAEYIATHIAFPSGWTQNFHYMIADAEKTYIVENGTAHQVENGVPAMTNFRLYGDPKDTTGEGQERYIALTNGANITSQWWTLTYTANGYRASDLPGITGETLTQLFNYWENNPRESHRGETFPTGTGTENYTWWQTVHTSIYDLTNRVLRVAVQETDDWYVFQVPSSGAKVDAYTKAEVDAKLEVVGDSTNTMNKVIATAASDAYDAYAMAETALGQLGDKANKYIPSDPGNLASLDENGDLADSGIAADDVAQLGEPVEFSEVTTRLFTSKEAVIGEPGTFVRIEEGSVTAPVDVRVEDAGEVHSLRAKADRAMIHHTNPTFSNEVAEVAKTVTPTPTGTLRLFDPVLNRWVILKSVNMNITLEVE